MSNLPSVSRIDLSPLGGIAGDMFAASLFDAFPFLYEGFLEDIDNLAVAGVTAELESRMCHGLEAKYFSVKQQTDVKPPRTLSAVTEFVGSKSLDKKLCDHVIGIFTLLAEAEAQVHGKTIDTIHFHEVSDWDSMVDIVAAGGIIARLNCPQWRVGALPLGGGTVNTAHGDIPIPAPATLALLKNFAWQDDGVGGERVTPTGAAILAYVKAQPSDGVAESAMLLAAGSGCGTRELPGRANLLRVTAFKSTAENFVADQVVSIAFEVDDMTAEEIAWASDKLREHDGVLDVSCLSLQAKKGRASTGMRLLARPDDMQSAINLCFAVTSTIGIRHSDVNRQVLHRSEIQTMDQDASQRVKLVGRPGNTHSAKAESDDLANASTLQQRRQAAHRLQDNALEELNEQLKKDDKA